MFCVNCGQKLEPTARFCPSCGAVSAAAPVPPPNPAGYPQAPQLTRSRSQRLIAGVCGGMALHYGWDISVTRVITALFVVLTGVGALAYIAAWVIIPEEPLALPPNTV
ncbi:PspC domain-containing protein [Granulicella sp. dw_53]|uniref:PspC domain-containing protein n=1 Tax=Granulicella sp. dw_53 TaxID=2719792 RepID=UPI001BD1C480|nr:PspC domain-containing protein [Granulicella sp. dw_53]